MITFTVYSLTYFPIIVYNEYLDSYFSTHYFSHLPQNMTNEINMGWNATLLSHSCVCKD